MIGLLLTNYWKLFSVIQTNKIKIDCLFTNQEESKIWKMSNEAAFILDSISCDEITEGSSFLSYKVVSQTNT